MPFDSGITPREGPRTDEVVLRPITTADVRLDYDAVMESREQLRLWEQSTWPAEDFTVEDNLADVTDLESRHSTGAAYTYTVLDPSGTQCLGCVYLFPTDAKFLTRAEVTPTGEAVWEDVDAVVYHWVRTPWIETGLDVRMLALLRRWLTEEWGFEDVVFVTNEQFTVQRRLFDESELSVRFEIREPGKPGVYLGFG